MARIITFKEAKRQGWLVDGLPMPDGSKRTYTAYGRADALLSIFRRWRAEYKAIKAAMACGLPVLISAPPAFMRRVN